jgi:type II secretory pathway predicted ATPase ExeA
MKGILFKQLIKASGLSQNAIARQAGCSGAILTHIIHRGVWPRRDPAALQKRLRELLLGTGAADADITAAFEQAAQDNQPGGSEFAEAISIPPGKEKKHQKEFWMLRKQTLSQAARRKFGFGRDPFSDEFFSPEDVYLSKDGRYVLETMYQTARHGGMTALIGESGSGKTTLRRALIERLVREDAKVIVIEPYTLGMDNGNKKMPALRSAHICEAVLAEIDPSYKGATASPEAKFRHMHKCLKESAQAGYRHLIILEEAHSLPLFTIKHLKRFFELTHGLTRLVSFLLIGQPELKHKLAETRPEVREIVQRMEVVELYPMEETEAYVRHRLERVGAKFDEVFASDAMTALSLRLIGPTAKGGGGGSSLLYPLSVGNMLTKALNLAAELKMPKIDAGIIQQA